MRFTARAACCFISAALFTASIGFTDEAPSKQPESKVLAGTVLDEAGRPVEGALVRVPTAPLQGKYEATTNSGGRFELTLPANFFPYSLTCIATSDDGSKQGFFQPKPTDQTIPDSITISLKPARPIAVSVVDENGEPVPQADVQVFARYRCFAQTRTDASGKNVLKLPAGFPLAAVAAVKPGAGLDYFLFRQPPPFPQDPAHLPQDSASPIEFKLAGARKVTVSVRDRQGNPIESVRVNPWYFDLAGKGGHLNVSGLTGQIRDTNAEGIATFDFIPAKNEGPITFWSRKSKTHKEQRATFDPASFVDRVEVTMSKLIPVRGRTVNVNREPVGGADITAVGEGYDFDDHRTSAQSDAQGNFQLMLAPNHYYLLVARKDRDVSPGVTFVLKETPPDDLVLHLQRGTPIHGKVTVGTDNSPVKDQSVSLYLKPTPDYYQLPEEQHLPNPTNSRSGVSPRHVQWTKTDANGRFEFLAGLGEHYLIGPSQIKPRKFTVDRQEAYDFDFHAERPDSVRLLGRVFFKGQPDKPLQRASVFVYPDGATANRYPRMKTDDRGIFQCDRPYTPCIAYVATDDKTHVAIRRIELEQRRLELPVEPASRATGRLVSEDSGQALPDEEIRYGIRVYNGEPGKSPWMTLFGGNANTSSDGSFELEGLVPGYQYEMSVVTDRDNDGHPRSWRGIGNVKLDKPGPIDLGDVSLAPGFKPPTVAERIDNWFADNTKPADRIAIKLRDARLAHQNVIAMIALKKHPFVQKFFQTKYDTNGGQNPQRKRLYEATANFELLAFQPIRLKRAANLPDGFAKLAESLPEDDTFTLAVFSPAGDLLATTNQQALKTDGGLDLEKMYAFLEEHTPELPDAKELVDAAFTRAKRENKKVFLQHSGAFCGPCILLARYLDKHRALIEKDYVWVKIDYRYKHGPEMVEQYRSEPGGIPWFVIIDPDGKPLVTSNAKEEGNIGYPSTDAGRKHFESILRQTAAHLTDDDIATLINDLID